MISLICRTALAVLALSLAACASAPPPSPGVDLTPPARRHADAKTTLENHY